MKILLKNKVGDVVSKLDITMYPNKESKYTFTKIINTKDIEEELDVFIDAREDTNYEALLIGLHKLNKIYNFSKLYMPYIPYVRADREIPIDENTVDLCGIEIYAEQLNSFNFKEIVTLVPHNVEKLKSVIKTKLTVIKHPTFFSGVLDDIFKKEKDVTIVLPDKGARKNFSEDLEELSRKYKFESITLNKVRDPKTGRIENMEIYEKTGGDITNSTIVIIDDLSSFGGTFCWANDIIKKEYDINRSILIVAHAEESAALGKLPETFDLIYCSDSISNIENEKFKIIKIQGE